MEPRLRDRARPVPPDARIRGAPVFTGISRARFPRNTGGVMAEFDLVVRGGMVIDGTHTPRYKADLGIKDGRIARIGRLQAHDGRKALDANGLIVAPGCIDLHTHYDAQVYWDPYCSISGWHGVTSAVIGNCGFGFAPVRPEMRERSM